MTRSRRPSVRLVSLAFALILVATCLGETSPSRFAFSRLPDTAEISERAILLETAPFLSDGPQGRDAGAALLPDALRGAPPAEGGWLLIQFTPSSSDAARRVLLEEAGAVLAASIPNHALLARVPAPSLGRIASSPDVRWLGRFHPGFKLSPELAASMTTTPGVPKPDPPARLRLSLAPAVDLAAFTERSEAAGIAVEEIWPDGAIVRMESAGALAGLVHDDAVLYAEAEPDHVLLNDSSRGICQASEPGVEPVHAQGIRGGDQIIAVMDSGIDPGHCCFDGGGKILSNEAYGGGVLGALCGNDHGTHVSGTAACSNAGDHDGLAPEAGIILQDIQGSGFTACTLGSVSPPGNLASAWQDALDAGARIHTNSWGGGGNYYGGGARAIDDFMWKNQDFLILYAAGNSGSSPGSLGSYSNAKNSLTIGGTRNGSDYERMYNSSSRGPAGDGRMLPDLLTPAQGVSSARNRSTPSCGWFTASGTSMATPAAAGSAALVREYYVRGFLDDGTASALDGFVPSAALVKATMLVSTRNMTDASARGPRPNNDQGYGRLTLDDALWFAGDPQTQRLAILDDRDTSTGLAVAGEEQVFELGLRSTAALKLVLAWTDAPGSASASKALVNDLDLIVETADGFVFRGNRGFVDGWTQNVSTEADRLNNKEAVMLASPMPGPVTITVRAETIGDVALHAQDFALVAVADADPACTPSGEAGVGNSLVLGTDGDDVIADFAAGDASLFTVYRGSSPSFMRQNPDPHGQDLVDEDGAASGVQWTDPGAAATADSLYYLFFGQGSCGVLLP